MYTFIVTITGYNSTCKCTYIKNKVKFSNMDSGYLDFKFLLNICTILAHLNQAILCKIKLTWKKILITEKLTNIFFMNFGHLEIVCPCWSKKLHVHVHTLHKVQNDGFFFINVII